MKPIQSCGYPIFFDDAWSELDRLLVKNAYSKVFILVDTNTKQACLPILQESLMGWKDFKVIEIGVGEQAKDLDVCIEVWKKLLDFDADRRSLLINLGGGVITDMGGFIASTFKRGIDFVHVPTTLLAQVDAAIGGKTGVNINHLKNIVGLFNPPKAIFVVPCFLKTLTQRHILSGLAEIIKHGLIWDADYFKQIQQIPLYRITSRIIYRSIDIKNTIVQQDPLETGIRKILNFGHTIGHALESYSLAHDSTPLLHGEAIAVGLVCEAYLSAQKNGLTENELIEIKQTILSWYSKYDLEESCFHQLIDLMKKDKKNTPQGINCSLLSQIGHCTANHYCSEDELYESLRYYFKAQPSF